MEITVHIASGFSKNQTGGNKAGVVLLEQPLTPQQKLAVAKELGFSETAFLSKSPQADFRFDYFTPKEEVDLCGHATIASFALLSYLNKLSRQQYRIDTNSGRLSITIKDGVIFMEQNKPLFSDVLSLEQLTDCFDTNAINDQIPIQIVSTGLKDILIPIKTTAQLQQVAPDFEEIKKVSALQQVVGMHLYAMEKERIVCRNFAPLFDINEESATGTSNAALACFLYQKCALEKEVYRFEQGSNLGEPSEIFVKLVTTSRKEIQHVYVGGRGHFCETVTIDTNTLA
ncbi:PhzF family phenazine biosynthesis protein [Enterococcus casseliflavus]|uniref:PhzF family phenazine biosynthesis protein n=1 Tax=Enterococcus sp. AZ051 TaxID=2774698 RepID=UPI0018835189|nr:PhzF family phenazine biosynthesis protein [Enterococcus casseliflavus]